MNAPRLRLWLALLLPAGIALMMAALAGQTSLGTTFAMFVVVAIAVVIGRVFVTDIPSDEQPAMLATNSPGSRTGRPVELFEAVLGTMFDGVVVVDDQQKLLYVNRAAHSLLELGNRQVVGRLLSEVSRSAPLQDVIETVLQTGTQQRSELQLTRQKLTVAVSAARLELDPTAAVLIVLHDVTELRRLERMRREFVSNVSHELKTPLTSIQAYADTLLSGGLEDEQHNRGFVERISEQSERLQSLIQDLLRLARIESEDVAIEIRAVDVGSVVTECVADRQPIADAKSLILRMEPSPAPVMASAEPEGLRTILNNLIDNGLNYTPSGGSVTVSWDSKDGQARITVADTGVGISREHQDRVFERFFRVDRARSRAMGGTGLGLSIVKHLVQTFGGSVDLKSEQNKGSRFTISLPLSESASLES